MVALALLFGWSLPHLSPVGWSYLIQPSRDGGPPLALTFGGMVVTVLLSLVCYRYVEAPARRLVRGLGLPRTRRGQPIAAQDERPKASGAGTF